ncbi:hypothetical protein UA38_11835 [Photobacterium kishitanii]|uniref:Uncharacterized protein n=1 Tax=Photobacterium kishitanii TaxID=318456 RepID=A0AAX0YTL8_9GAMM|nr:hypothetical protein [Photobacterium kishitanii]KJG57059.1 hypothetical protein UA38_11835 [Photobacterium kishitanii]PSW46898.1 hypothetical protein C0W66_21165 [Photobacterium kishitanii]PSX18323.1 hypothetical protein C0W70_15760 [Photobacterium kishitanii]PSX26824.1 hypothetical protein C0W52_16695 [Photobacterium kishitanii]PSX31110.1 hypothetical protein C0W39_18140 [Photobacterium kishitanii]
MKCVDTYLDTQLNKMRLLQLRHKCGGKMMGNYRYMHASIASINDLICIQKFEYDVVKMHIKTNELTFLKCDDWLVKDEPIIIRSAKLIEGSIQEQTLQKARRVFHHKWLFHNPFDNSHLVRASKLRTIVTRTVIGKNKMLSSRIGWLDYWDKWLQSNEKLLIVEEARQKKIITDIVMKNNCNGDILHDLFPSKGYILD